MDIDMPLSSIAIISHYHIVLSLVLLLPPAVFSYYFLGPSSKKKQPSTSIRKDDIILASPTPHVQDLRPKAKGKPIQWYRNLFFQLQNLEDHPHVLEPARDELLDMFSRAVSFALEKPETSILRVHQYDAKSVWKFIGDEHERTLKTWGHYLDRRKQGKGPELFATPEAARKWLLHQAPAKFVDGAWLAHVNKITTPFALRSITKDVWQVLSEELGDGDLSKHHVYLYRKLLEACGVDLPEGHSREFIDAAHWQGQNNQDIWEAATGQLLISLFPNDFLPEILGFNMHYELITLDTMRAAHELKELGINPYYFLIHIAIDNADSGHTAMATHTVTRYLDMIRANEGEVAVERAWKRIQVGYTLSQALGTSFSHEEEQCLASTPDVRIPDIPLLDPLSARVIGIMKAKAPVSHQFHCQSRARIGRYSLAEYLAPSLWAEASPRQLLDLLIALSQAKPWIYPGSSSKSLLVRALSWQGCMFGAFTNTEVKDLCAWIDSLGPESHAWLYWSFTLREPSASSKDVVGELWDPARHHPVVKPFKVDISSLTSISAESETDFELQAGSELKTFQKIVDIPSNTCLSDIVALWFANIGLLENTINTPSRTASPLYASILRLLRAQSGFAIETHVVAGMDEMNRLSCPSLVEIGVELISRAGWTNALKPTCLHDILLLTRSQGQTEQSARLAEDMLRWAVQPTANLGLLLGLASAFLGLKDAIVRSPELLSRESRLVLDAIVVRERQCLEECARELRRVDETQYRQFVRGYHFAREALDRCLSGERIRTE